MLWYIIYYLGSKSEIGILKEQKNCCTLGFLLLFLINELSRHLKLLLNYVVEYLPMFYESYFSKHLTIYCFYLLRYLTTYKPNINLRRYRIKCLCLEVMDINLRFTSNIDNVQQCTLQIPHQNSILQGVPMSLEGIGIHISEMLKNR